MIFSDIEQKAPEDDLLLENERPRVDMSAAFVNERDAFLRLN